jgi:hypothetical protein
MKHLKLFKEGFDTEDFYKKVDRDEYHEKVGSDTDASNNRIEFNKIDRITLEEAMVDCEMRWKIKRGKSANPNEEPDYHYYDYLKIWEQDDIVVDDKLYLYKVPDDYFAIYMPKFDTRKTQYYICDQINGVIKFLLDKDIIVPIKKKKGED